MLEWSQNVSQQGGSVICFSETLMRRSDSRKHIQPSKQLYATPVTVHAVNSHDQVNCGEKWIAFRPCNIFHSCTWHLVPLHNQFQWSKQSACCKYWCWRRLFLFTVLVLLWSAHAAVEIFTKTVSAERSLRHAVIGWRKAWVFKPALLLSHLWKVPSASGRLPERRRGWKQSETTHQGSCARLTNCFLASAFFFITVPEQGVFLRAGGGGEAAGGSGSYLGRAHMSPWRIFSLTLMGEFTRIFRLSPQRTRVTQRPIHAREWLHSWVQSILPVEFANCSASSISETHWWKWRHSQLF